MTPVVLLSDAFLANGIDPWKIPDIAKIPEIEVKYDTNISLSKSDHFMPYSRNNDLARPWVIPGTKGLEHRIGGLEKEDKTGNVSYDPLNHEKMVNIRAEKVAKISNDIGLQTVNGPKEGDVLVLSWGSTYGAAHTAAENLRKKGMNIADTNLRYLNPFPNNLGEILNSYKRILIPEMNKGQLQLLIQARYAIEVIGLNKVQGKPFQVREIQEEIEKIVGGIKTE
jgi:2-oxoglutarate ferredoxin oxidoreductase subunit alpha